MRKNSTNEKHFLAPQYLKRLHVYVIPRTKEQAHLSISILGIERLTDEGYAKTMAIATKKVAESDVYLFYDHVWVGRTGKLYWYRPWCVKFTLGDTYGST